MGVESNRQESAREPRERPAEVPADRQLALDVGLSDPPSFANFVAEDDELVHLVRRTASGDDARTLYLFGPAGTGKTHLLLAAVAEAAKADERVMALPLAELEPASVRELEPVDLLCLDDVDRVAGQAEWERELFNLYNRLEASGGRLIMSAEMPPARLPVQLADLRSRLASALTLRLRPLSEAGCRLALRERAQRRGFELGPEVIEYLLRRVRRDIGSLAALLDVLEASSLAHQRRLTVPFVSARLAEAGWERVGEPG